MSRSNQQSATAAAYGYTWPRRRLLWAMLTIGALACTGCYDPHALIDQVRADASRNRLHEVDLGTYRTTMPRDPATHTFTEMELRIFGTVPQYRVAAIEEQLKTEGYRLRHETLSAIRQTTREELAEPDLAKLRNRLTQVTNNVLTEAPVKSIGFEHIRIVYE